MSKVMVHQADGGKSAIANPFLPRVEHALDAIRTRAYELFEQRGRAPGGDLSDWLQAERELFLIPEAEIRDTASALEIEMEAPGFPAKNIEVIALPRELVVEATESRKDPCQSRSLYRRFELSTPIDPDAVKATLHEGHLKIEAPKKETKATAQAAAA